MAWDQNSLGGSHWLPERPDGLAVDCTVGDLLRRAAAAAPERVALVDACGEPPPIGGLRRRWTYAQLLESTEAVARALLARFVPGDRLAFWATGSAEWLLADLGAALAGLVVVPVNPAYRSPEAALALRMASPVGVLYGRTQRGVDLGDMALALAGEISAIRVVGDLEQFVDEALDASLTEARSVPLPEVMPDDAVQVQFTSGTTGTPKGVVLHHGGFAGMPATAIGLMELGPAPVWLNVMPLHHIGGSGLSTLGPIAAIGTHVLADRFTALRALALIEEEAVSVMGTVPTMLFGMLDHVDRARRDLSSLRVVISGGAAVSASLVRRIESTLGVRFVVAFGQTECHGHITQTRPGDRDDDKADTCGQPLPGVEVKLVDPGSGSIVPIDEVGEVWTRSPLVMLGYLDDPAATADVVDADGFLHTGDLCTIDPRGYVRFVGRAKDMIVRGGENISPREIEDRLREHPLVVDAAVIGVPEERLGESICAVVQPLAGTDPSTDELAEWVGAALAPFKAPTTWMLIDELPLTASGKVHKPTLRAQWAGEPPSSVARFAHSPNHV